MRRQPEWNHQMAGPPGAGQPMFPGAEPYSTVPMVPSVPINRMGYGAHMPARPTGTHSPVVQSGGRGGNSLTPVAMVPSGRSISSVATVPSMNIPLTGNAATPSSLSPAYYGGIAAIPAPTTITTSTAPPGTAPRKYELLPPSGKQVHKLETFGFGDFFPQKADQAEDMLSRAMVTSGFQSSVAVEQETASASERMREHIRTDAGQRIRKRLGDFINRVADENALHRKVPPSKPRPPPTRTILSLDRRDAWINDLAGGVEPLPKLAKTVPHGFKDLSLIEVLARRQVPMLRASWFARMVGLDEMQSRTSADYPTYWTGLLTKFLEKQLAESTPRGVGAPVAASAGGAANVEAQSTAKERRSRWMYTVRLVCWQAAEGLLDMKALVEWAVKFFKRAPSEHVVLFMSILLPLLGEIVKMRVFCRMLLETCLARLSKLRLSVYHRVHPSSSPSSPPNEVMDGPSLHRVQFDILNQLVQFIILESPDAAVDLPAESQSHLSEWLSSDCASASSVFPPLRLSASVSALLVRADAFSDTSFGLAERRLDDDLFLLPFRLDAATAQEPGRLSPTLSDAALASVLRVMLDWAVRRGDVSSRLLCCAHLRRVFRTAAQRHVLQEGIVAFMDALPLDVGASPSDAALLLASHLVDVGLFEHEAYVRRLVSRGDLDPEADAAAAARSLRVLHGLALPSPPPADLLTMRRSLFRGTEFEAQMASEAAVVGDVQRTLARAYPLWFVDEAEIEEKADEDMKRDAFSCVTAEMRRCVSVLPAPLRVSLAAECVAAARRATSDRAVYLGDPAASQCVFDALSLLLAMEMVHHVAPVVSAVAAVAELASTFDCLVAVLEQHECVLADDDAAREIAAALTGAYRRLRDQGHVLWYLRSYCADRLLRLPCVPVDVSASQLLLSDARMERAITRKFIVSAVPSNISDAIQSLSAASLPDSVAFWADKISASPSGELAAAVVDACHNYVSIGDAAIWRTQLAFLHGVAHSLRSPRVFEEALVEHIRRALQTDYQPQFLAVLCWTLGLLSQRLVSWGELVRRALLPALARTAAEPSANADDALLILGLFLLGAPPKTALESRGPLIGGGLLDVFAARFGSEAAVALLATRDAAIFGAPSGVALLLRAVEDTQLLAVSASTWAADVLTGLINSVRVGQPRVAALASTHADRCITALAAMSPGEAGRAARLLGLDAAALESSSDASAVSASMSALRPLDLSRQLVSLVYLLARLQGTLPFVDAEEEDGAKIGAEFANGADALLRRTAPHGGRVIRELLERVPPHGRAALCDAVVEHAKSLFGAHESSQSETMSSDCEAALVEGMCAAAQFASDEARAWLASALLDYFTSVAEGASAAQLDAADVFGSDAAPEGGRLGSLADYFGAEAEANGGGVSRKVDGVVRGMAVRARLLVPLLPVVARSVESVVAWTDVLLVLLARPSFAFIDERARLRETLRDCLAVLANGLSEEQRTAAARQSREWQVDTPTLLQSRPLDDILRCLQILPTVSADTWSQPADAPSSVAAFDATRVRRGVSAYRRELDGGAAMQLWVVERAAGRAREDEASDAPPAKRQHR